MDIRQQFLDYFQAKNHQIYDSAPLVPNDASLLFTNAGMVQFKDIFTGKIPPPKIPRATSSQLCIRAGGKHNDLENVGYTARHHTLFEMLGNFSFGDYSKREAIAYAWEFVTEKLEFDKSLLYVTIHESDDEAFELWKKHIAPERIKRMGDKDNFWQMGDTGPCGPCSEIYYDQGEEYFNSAEDYFGGEGDRFLEIWNLVFMQYERDKNGNLNPLPRPSIDTGMGLERVATLVESRETGKAIVNNYDTKIFYNIMKKIEELTGKDYIRDNDPQDKRINHKKIEITESVFNERQPTYKETALSWQEIQSSFRVIADHARSVAFLLAQVVNFDKEGRGYVLRRILRRAVRHGYLLGVKKPFLYEVVGVVCDDMGKHYKYLSEKKDTIMKQCKEEEERFFETIESGITLFKNELSRILGNLLDLEFNFGREFIRKSILLGIEYAKKLSTLPLQEVQEFANGTLSVEKVKLLIEQKNKEIDFKQKLKPPIFSGEVAFKLYDTYGFPLDLTQDMLKSYGMELDLYSFNKCMEAQKSRSKASWRGSGDEVQNGDFGALLEEFGENKFIGYEEDCAKSKVLALLDTNYRRIEVLNGDGYIFLDLTPLYAEGGGPVGDSGEIFIKGKKVANVIYTKKYFGLNISEISTSSELKVGDIVEVKVSPNRLEIAKHHSATHLLHLALRQILGLHIAQAGSLVESTRLRFDFSHPKALSSEELSQIQDFVNERIWEGNAQQCEIMPIDEAKAKGACALFGEKYGERVRVVSFGESMELCGGIHCSNSADIGSFYITKESGVSSGVRRIEAVCGKAGYNYTKENLAILSNAREVLKTSDIMAGIAKLKDNIQKYKDLKTKTDSGVKSLNFEMIDSVKLMIVEVAANLNIKTIIDEAKKENPKVAIMLIANDNGKLSVSCGVNGVANLKANEWIKSICEILGGGGGGRADFATAGGKYPHKIKDALQIAREFALTKIHDS